MINLLATVVNKKYYSWYFCDQKLKLMLNLFLKSENLVVPSQASPRIGQMFITMSMFDSFLYLGMPRPEIEISKEGSEFMMTIENKRKKFKQRTSSEDFEWFQGKLIYLQS